MKTTIITSVVFIFLIACNGSSQQQGETTATGSALQGSIQIDGSSTVYPITEAVAEEFRAVQPDVKVTVGVSGTGGGFKKFSRGELDITNASRPIKESEATACKEKNINYLELEVAYDGLAVVMHPENNWVDHFTVAELKKLWEPEAQGKITKWNQIRPEWPNEEIHLYGPGVASGTFDYFTEAIVGESGKSRGDFTASEDDNVLVQGIEGDKFSLGFFGLAYFEENKDKLKLAAVDNGSGPVLPSTETVKNKTYAPLSRPLFIYVTQAAASRTEVKEFIKFYLGNAGTLSKEVGYIPLQDAEYESVKKTFESFSGGAGL